MQRIEVHYLDYFKPTPIKMPLGSHILYVDKDICGPALFTLEGTNPEIEIETRIFNIYTTFTDVSARRYDKIFIGAFKNKNSVTGDLTWYFVFEDRKK